MIKPLPGYVLIEPIEDEVKTSGGVYLPDSSKDKPCKGKVISKSSWFLRQGKFDEVDYGVDLGYGHIKSGDTVLYKKWTNQEVDHDGKKYLLVSFSELLGVIE